VGFVEKNSIFSNFSGGGQKFGHLIQPVQLFFDQNLLKKEDFSSKMHERTCEIPGTPALYPSKTPINKIKQVQHTPRT
jgi:hypothetical protein